jgi:hypothetical protein
MFIGFVRDITERARAEAEMKARTRQERAVADLSRKALAGCDLRWLLREAVGVVAQVLEIEFSKVLELAPAGDQLVLRAGVGWAEDLRGSQSRSGTRRFPGGLHIAKRRTGPSGGPRQRNAIPRGGSAARAFGGERNERRHSRTRAALWSAKRTHSQEAPLQQS